MNYKGLITGLGLTVALMTSPWVWGEGDVAAGRRKAEMCSGCHGEDGNGNAPIFPKLAGQHLRYLVKQLRDFKSQLREEPTMSALAEALSEEDIADLSAWFAKGAVRVDKNDDNNDLGKRIYQVGDLSRRIPACSGCHGPAGQGNGEAVFPALRGQYSAYVAKTLREFKAGERKNDRNGMMRAIASKLTDEEIGALSDYVSAMKP